MMKKFIFILFISIVYFLPLTKGYANSMQDLVSIEQQVKNFVETQISVDEQQRLSVETGHIDRRLHLARCELPLDLTAASDRSMLQNTVVNVACRGTRPWRIYVPVKIALFSPVVVANKSLEHNKIISEDDVRLEERNMAKLHREVYTDIDEVIGKQAKHRIMAGKVMTANAVQMRKMVKRGDTVTLIAQTGVVSVTTVAHAQQDGALGDKINVKNQTSKRLVEAVVIGEDRVEIRL